MSKLLKYKPEFDKVELQSIEKAAKLFADRNGIIYLNNMVIAMKELKKLRHPKRQKKLEGYLDN